jgi:hypothetical protein
VEFLSLRRKERQGNKKSYIVFLGVLSAFARENSQYKFSGKDAKHAKEIKSYIVFLRVLSALARKPSEFILF